MLSKAQCVQTKLGWLVSRLTIVLWGRHIFCSFFMWFLVTEGTPPDLWWCGESDAHVMSKRRKLTGASFPPTVRGGYAKVSHIDQVNFTHLIFSSNEPHVLLTHQQADPVSLREKTFHFVVNTLPQAPRRCLCYSEGSTLYSSRNLVTVKGMVEEYRR